MPEITIIPPRTSTTTVLVAAYCRVSTEDPSQEDSLMIQTTHWEQVISDHPDWILSAVYAERESVTHAETRPELMRLLTNCQEGRVHVILTKSVSRFSRNTVDCLNLVRTLRSLSVSIIFEKERIDTGSMTSELFLSMRISFSRSSLCLTHRRYQTCPVWSIRKKPGSKAGITLPQQLQCPMRS